MFRRRKHDTAVSYLLGELKGSELVAFEERVFTEPHAADELEAAEHDLIDAYLSGDLDPAPASAFKMSYLGSPSRRSKVEAARIMRQRLPLEAQVLSEVRSDSPWSFWAALRTPLFAGVSLLILTVGLGWFLFSGWGPRTQEIADVPEVIDVPTAPDNADEDRPRQSGNDERVETPNGRRELPRTAAPRVFAATLLPATRGSERPTLTIPRDADSVVIRLVHDNQKAFEKYRVIVCDGTGRIVVSRDMPARSGGTISLTLKPTQIKNGNYEAALLGINAIERGEELMFYEFLIERK